MAYAKQFYRKYCYQTCKQTERVVRTALFFLFNTLIPKFNSFRIFGLPSGWKTVKSQIVIPRVPFECSSLNTLETKSHPYFEMKKFEGRDAKIALLPGGIQTEYAASLTKKGYLAREFTEQFTMKGEFTHKLFTFRSNRCFAKIPHFDLRVASLVAECPNNYYHWLFDVLPKIHILEKAHIPVDRYYVATELPFQRDSLRALGIDRIIPAQKYPVISADTLVTTTFPCLNGISKWSLDFLRNWFSPGQPKRRFFISRRDASMRRILNEEEFAPLLEKYGFETVVPGKLSFAEQVALFRDAEVILAPHGAGLSNIVFAPSTAKVIEIYSPRSTCVCYWVLANQLGMPYYYLRGIDDPSTYAKTEPAHDDIIVSPEKLLRTLTMASIA